MFLMELLHGHAPAPPPDDTLVQWDPSFSVGNGLIDGEHREIVTVLNRLYSDWSHGGHGLNPERELDHLEQLVCTHFANEEQVMARHHCPSLEEHRREHQSLVAELRRLRGLRGDNRQAREAKLLCFARKLVLGHVLNWDLDARDYMHG